MSWMNTMDRDIPPSRLQARSCVTFPGIINLSKQALYLGRSHLFIH